MTVGELSAGDFTRRLSGPGLRVRIGPFVARVQSGFPDVQAAIGALYRQHDIEPGEHGGHFTVRVGAPSRFRTLYRPQAQLTVDGISPFIPLPRRMATLMLEGGLNWCIGNLAHQFVIVHAATVERGGRALLLPAAPGSGKSTLCAALIHRGWRLLSDEFALIDPDTGAVSPCPRPVALKDGAHELIKTWAPTAWMTDPIDNHEGERVSYMRPPENAIAHGASRAEPSWILVPKYVPGAAMSVEPVTRARALMHLADNSFNFNHHGPRGFERLAAVADRAPAVVLRYSALDAGVKAVDELTAG